MSARLRVLPRALQDIADARAWYEAKREGLGLEFCECFEASLKVIQQFPFIYPVVVRDARRCLMGRFPYGIIYRVPEPDLILIIAVLHGARDPEVLRQFE